MTARWRHSGPNDQALSEMMTADVQHAFQEDRDVLNEVQKGLSNKKGMSNKTSPHIDLPIDWGAAAVPATIASHD